MQPWSKNFGEILSLFPIEICMQTWKLFFAIFSKATFWTYVVHNLDGRFEFAL